MIDEEQIHLNCTQLLMIDMKQERLNTADLSNYIHKEMKDIPEKMGSEEYPSVNISYLTHKFKTIGNLTPEEMLSLIKSKKYAKKIEKKRRENESWIYKMYGEKEDMSKYLKKIEEVEAVYYKDILPIPEALKKSLLKRPLMTMGKAKKKLMEFNKIVDECGLNENVKKSFIQTLDFLMTHR